MAKIFFPRGGGLATTAVAPAPPFFIPKKINTRAGGNRCITFPCPGSSPVRTRPPVEVQSGGGTFSRFIRRGISPKPIPLGRPQKIKIPPIIPTPVAGQFEPGKPAINAGTLPPLQKQKTSGVTNFTGNTNLNFPNRLKNVAGGTQQRNRTTFFVVGGLIVSLLILRAI